MTADSTPETLSLGQRVTFDQCDVLSRGYVDLTESDRRWARGRYGVRRKAWTSLRDRGVAEAFGPRQQTGVIVGARSLQNGLTDYEPEVGTAFAGDERVPVYLIATGMHDGLVRVRRDHVHPEIEENRA